MPPVQDCPRPEGGFKEWQAWKQHAELQRQKSQLLQQLQKNQQQTSTTERTWIHQTGGTSIGCVTPVGSVTPTSAYGGSSFSSSTNVCADLCAFGNEMSDGKSRSDVEGDEDEELCEAFAFPNGAPRLSMRSVPPNPLSSGTYSGAIASEGLAYGALGVADDFAGGSYMRRNSSSSSSAASVASARSVEWERATDFMHDRPANPMARSLLSEHATNNKAPSPSFWTDDSNAREQAAKPKTKPDFRYNGPSSPMASFHQQRGSVPSPRSYLNNIHFGCQKRGFKRQTPGPLLADDKEGDAGNWVGSPRRAHTPSSRVGGNCSAGNSMYWFSPKKFKADPSLVARASPETRPRPLTPGLSTIMPKSGNGAVRATQPVLLPSQPRHLRSSQQQQEQEQDTVMQCDSVKATTPTACVHSQRGSPQTPLTQQSIQAHTPPSPRNISPKPQIHFAARSATPFHDERSFTSS